MTNEKTQLGTQTINQNDKIAHYDPEYDTDKESDNIFFSGKTMCSRLIEYMEFAISNKAYNINEILKGEEDEADAVESNNRETYVRQNIKIDTNELDNIIGRVHHVFVRYNELINLRLKEFQTNPKQALNTLVLNTQKSNAANVVAARYSISCVFNACLGLV